MKILVVTRAPAGSQTGNRITALRWAGILRDLGHRAALAPEYQGQACDALVALHARKSFGSVQRFRKERPGSPLVVALTGTDLYQDLRRSARARRSIETADRLVLLQSEGLREVPARLRSKARVIHQSASRAPRRRAPAPGAFDVCVVAHLRSVKDPLRAAEAAARLPPASQIRIFHVGAALEPGLARKARNAEGRTLRYRWLGPRPHADVLRLLARSRLLLLTSRLEGGANVLSEALAARVPVLCSRIPGSVGILGRDYPGYFQVGDARALAALLSRAETDGAFYRRLRASCARLRPLVARAREERAWRDLLRELTTADRG